MESVTGEAIPVVAEGLTAGAVEQIVGHLEEEIEATRQAAEALYPGPLRRGGIASGSAM